MSDTPRATLAGPADLPVDGPGMPGDWPSGWPSLWPRVAQRAAFVVAVQLLTVLGLAVAANPTSQWWATLPPLLLLVGPVTRPARVRQRVRRAAAAHSLQLDGDGVVWARRRVLPGRRPVARVSRNGVVHYLC